jgi:hypothetical protein
MMSAVLDTVCLASGSMPSFARPSNRLSGKHVRAHVIQLSAEQPMLASQRRKFVNGLLMLGEQRLTP